MVVLPIASGKGGVGKSLLAANLSIALADAGRRVVLADLDLGASNAHTMLGLRGVSRGIGTFLSVPRARFEDIVLPTDYDNLSFVPGDAEVPGVAALKPAQKARLVRCLLQLPADFLVLDLGPGTGVNPLDFFLTGSAGIVVTTPGLTSVLNAYLFLKNAVVRLMYGTVDRGSRAWDVLEELRKDPGGLQRGYVPRILERIAAEDRASHARLVEALAGLRPRLVLNMVEDPADAEKAARLRRSVRDYLGIELRDLGVILRDEVQAVALGSRVPIVRYKPGSVISRAVARIAERLLKAAPEDARPGAAARLAEVEGPETAEAEAASDFQLLRQDVEDLLSGGTLSAADLVEAVRTQQVEIAELRRENAILRAQARRAGPAAPGGA